MDDRWAVALPGEGLDWLGEIGRAAVVIRPDRYILGCADSSAELLALLERLPRRVMAGA